MKVGIVCPYTWEVPGGVQAHVRDLAEALVDLGHEVSVITPADDDTPVPSYVVPAGRAMLRTSVMATHTEAHIEEALRVFEMARSTSA